jgi:hypothetical protein
MMTLTEPGDPETITEKLWRSLLDYSDFRSCSSHNCAIDRFKNSYNGKLSYSVATSKGLIAPYTYIRLVGQCVQLKGALLIFKHPPQERNNTKNNDSTDITMGEISSNDPSFLLDNLHTCHDIPKIQRG